MWLDHTQILGPGLFLISLVSSVAGAVFESWIKDRGIDLVRRCSLNAKVASEKLTSEKHWRKLRRPASSMFIGRSSFATGAPCGPASALKLALESLLLLLLVPSLCISRGLILTELERGLSAIYAGHTLLSL